MPLLRSMEAYERTAVADAFEEQSYAAGEVILREAEQGDTFYLLVSGTAAATKAGGEGRRLLLEYKEGDYFGELALLNNRRVPVCMCMCAWHVHGMCTACARHVHRMCIACAWLNNRHACTFATHPSPLTPHSSLLLHSPCYHQASRRVGRVPHRLHLRAPGTAYLRAAAWPRDPHTEAQRRELQVVRRLPIAWGA